MKAMLEQLKHADPVTWERYSQFSQHDNIYDETALQYILQGILQDAIHEREYIWSICIDPYKDNQFRADIFVVGESCITDDMTICDIATEWGDTPTHALLAACLEAIGFKG